MEVPNEVKCLVQNTPKAPLLRTILQNTFKRSIPVEVFETSETLETWIQGQDQPEAWFGVTPAPRSTTARYHRTTDLVRLSGDCEYDPDDDYVTVDVEFSVRAYKSVLMSTCTSVSHRVYIPIEDFRYMETETDILNYADSETSIGDLLDGGLCEPDSDEFEVDSGDVMAADTEYEDLEAEGVVTYMDVGEAVSELNGYLESLEDED